MLLQLEHRRQELNHRTRRTFYSHKVVVVAELGFQDDDLAPGSGSTPVDISARRKHHVVAVNSRVSLLVFDGHLRVPARASSHPGRTFVKNVFDIDSYHSEHR